MAQLKDLVVTGPSRLIGTLYASGGITGNLNGNASTATAASYLKYYASNEINFSGNDTATEIYFNYRNQSTGASTGNTAITHYYFCNRNEKCDGVMLIASGFSGNAGSASKLQTSRAIFGRTFDGTADVAGKPIVYGTYTSTASSRFVNSGIEVRENGLVGSAQSDIGYAPSIGFHWSNRTAATFLYHSDGNFYLRKQDGTTRASLDANIIGNASSSSSCSGNAATATALQSSAGSSTTPVYFSSGKPVACSLELFPTYGKTIDANFTSAFRTQAKGNYANGDFIAALRCDTASVSGAPLHGSGIGWGRADTHGYLYVSYSGAEAYIGGGNVDKLNWVKGISFTDHTHNYAGSSSAGGDANNALKLAGLSASHATGAGTIVTRDGSGYTYLNYINSNTANNENPTISQIIVTNGSDNFYRKSSLAHLKASLGTMPTAYKTAMIRTQASASYDPGQNRGEWVEFAAGDNYNLPSNAWYHIFTGQGDDTRYTTQLALGMTTPNIAYRRKDGNTWQGWQTILTSGNYTSYTVKKDGTGASGTWGINVTGSAGSVAWGNVTGKPSTFTPASHKHTKSEITDFPTSMPASDVYAWAKASTKPTYTASEVGAAAASHTHSGYAASDHTHSGYVATSGGDILGKLREKGGNSDYTTYKYRNIGFGTTSTPTTDGIYGASGAIYFMYS